MLNSTHSPFFNVGQLEVDLLWAIFSSKFFSEAPTESSSISVRSPALLLLVHRVEEGALQDQERAKREPSHQLGIVDVYKHSVGIFFLLCFYLYGSNEVSLNHIRVDVTQVILNWRENMRANT